MAPRFGSIDSSAGKRLFRVERAASSENQIALTQMQRKNRFDCISSLSGAPGTVVKSYNDLWKSLWIANYRRRWKIVIKWRKQIEWQNFLTPPTPNLEIGFRYEAFLAVVVETKRRNVIKRKVHSLPAFKWQRKMENVEASAVLAQHQQSERSPAWRFN